MPAPIVAGAVIAGSVAFEYAWQKAHGNKATTKQLVMAGAFGALPISKLKLLKAPYRARKFRLYSATDDVRHLMPLGTRLIREPVEHGMGLISPYVGASWVAAPIVSYGTGRVKRGLFSRAYDAVTGSSGKAPSSRGRGGPTKLSQRARRSLSLGTPLRVPKGRRRFR